MGLALSMLLVQGKRARAETALWHASFAEWRRRMVHSAQAPRVALGSAVIAGAHGFGPAVADEPWETCAGLQHLRGACGDPNEGINAGIGTDSAIARSTYTNV